MAHVGAITAADAAGVPTPKPKAPTDDLQVGDINPETGQPITAKLEPMRFVGNQGAPVDPAPAPPDASRSVDRGRTTARPKTTTAKP